MDPNFGIYKFEGVFLLNTYVALIANQIQSQDKKIIHPSLSLSFKDINDLTLQERSCAPPQHSGTVMLQSAI